MTNLKPDLPFVCPVCASSFKSTIVESVTHQGQDSDFFPQYVGPSPMPFFLVQCVNCRYCAYPDDYRPENLEAQKISVTRAMIDEVLAQPLSKKLPPDARRFYLSAKLYEKQGRSPYLIGNLYLRASWCCRQVQDRHAEIEMQQLAARFLKEAVEKSMVTPENLAVVTYLIAEIYRRLEDRSQAREWFGRIEDVLFDAEEQRWLTELAQAQAELNEHFIN